MKFDDERYLKVVSDKSKTVKARIKIILLVLKYLKSFFESTTRKQQTIVINGM